jgi:hypothetical protein
MAEAPVGLTIAEKFFGLLIIVLGAIIFYVTTFTNFESGINLFIFLVVGSALIGLGVILVLSRAE